MFENPALLGTNNKFPKKVKAKNVFAGIPIKTPAYLWKIDREWKIKCNPIFEQQENNYLAKDRRMLEKRRYGKILKNLALEKDLEIKNKKIDKELRKDLY